ncbi:MAG: hypothetical protein AAF213_09805 [Pseudomonadota bacterium]
MKGLFVLLTMLAVIGGLIVGVGYYIYGDKFYDILTMAEARLQAAADANENQADQPPEGDAQAPGLNTTLPLAGGVPPSSPDPVAPAQTPPGDDAAPPPLDIAAQDNLPASQQPTQPVKPQATPQATQQTAQQVAPRPPPSPVRFADRQGRFAAIFPGPVSQFDNYLAGLVPNLVGSSETFAATGLDIVAQVSILNWRDDVSATANDLAQGFAEDPDRTMGEETASAILDALLGDTATVEGVRGFNAYGRQSVELTGLIPDGDGGMHKSVVWLMPDAANLIAVVIRAYSDRGLLGPEATRFNQDFSLQAAAIPNAEPAQ